MRWTATARVGLCFLGLGLSASLVALAGCGGGDPAAEKEAAKQHEGRNKAMEDFMKSAPKEAK